MSRVVKLLNAGRLSYESGLQLQNILIHHHRIDKHLPNSLVFVEHNPVYTIGIRTKDYSENDEKKLKALGADFYRTNRGGLITFHGPGQLVAYPIINIKEFGIGVRCYVSKIEKMIIRLCAEYGLKGETSPDTGVWIEDRKICAIGVHASRYVTSHGLALNCNTDLKWFDHIVPCGIKGKSVTSLSKELGVEVNLKDAIPVLKRAFQDEFNCKVKDMEQEKIIEIMEQCGKGTETTNLCTSS